MKKMLMGTAGCAIAIVASLLATTTASAEGQQSLSSTLGNTLDFRKNSPNAYADIQTAIANETARKRGYGGASYTSTTDIGTQVVTNNGAQTTTGATNIVNSSSSSTTSTVGAGSSGILINAQTGSTQYSGSANQGATAQVATSSGTSSSGTNASTGPTNK